MKILEIRKIINRASSSFQIKAIRYIPRLSFPFLYNRNNTLRREGKKKKKKRKSLSFVTLLPFSYFEGPLVRGVVALNGDLDSLLEAGCNKVSDLENFFQPFRITC